MISSTSSKVDLSTYNNNWYHPGPSWKLVFWIICSTIFFTNSLSVFNGLKIFFLRIFGGKVGKGVVIKPNVHIKYPWFLTIGDYTWVGENAWIDNLTNVVIGNNVCISQGSYILTGNHNFSKSTFDLMVKSVIIEDGVWIGAKSVVCPGVICRSHSVLTVASIANKNLEPYGIYKGNPANYISERIIKE